MDIVFHYCIAYIAHTYTYNLIASHLAYTAPLYSCHNRHISPSSSSSSNGSIP